MKVKNLRPQVKLVFYILLAILMIGIGFYFQASKLKTPDTNEDEKKMDEVQEDVIPYENVFPSLRELYHNSDIKAELSISSINLKELVVQAQDNDFYLNHDIYQNENINGSIFIDYRTSDIDMARQLNIYGHNSLDDETIPFKVLEQYLQEEFFFNNLLVDLKTDKGAYSYKIFAASVIAKSDNEHMIISLEGDEFLSHLSLMRSKALYDTKETVREDDHLLVIQTCLFNPEKLLLLMAKRV